MSIDNPVGPKHRARPKITRIVALDARTQRVVDAIECCEDAVDLRSIALDAFYDGPRKNLAEIQELCKEAADVVKAAHPEIPAADLTYLFPYICAQVRGIATGEMATLLLPPLDLAN